MSDDPRGEDDQEFGDGGDDEGQEPEIEADGEGDDAEADAELEADGEDEPEAEVARPQRRESRYQRNERTAREAKEEARQLRERLDRLEGQRNQTPPDPAAQQRADAEELERLRLMDPVDALHYVRQQERQRLGQYMQGVEGRIADRQDKSEFDAACREDKAMLRLAPEVERHIADARRQGNYTLARQTVADLLYGQEMRARRREGTPRQQREAQRRVARQTVRPGGGRGEVPRQRRQADGDADEKFLRGITIGDL